MSARALCIRTIGVVALAPFGHLEFEEFNGPPVVESADTGPFFHNHTVVDLESSIAFYGTPAFQTSLQNGATPVCMSADPNDPEVQAIVALLLC